MIISLNGKDYDATGCDTLLQLAEKLSLSKIGAAIAVNARMVPKTEWEKFVLHESDKVIIIKAACGG